MTNRSFVSPFRDHHPRIEEDVYVDVSARIIGNVTLLGGAAVWPGAVLRGDDSSIYVAEGVMVMDQVLLEGPTGHPIILEKNVTVSHKACIHGAVIGEAAFIGIGAIVLDGVEIGEYSLIGPGAVIPPGVKIPPRSVVVGHPGKIIRQISDVEIKTIRRQHEHLVKKAQEYRTGIV
jgi:carbonic anhydrase/acetyltransferase-like protein (isoleucine patch superfamily)